jgi:hypothetical protein
MLRAGDGLYPPRDEPWVRLMETAQIPRQLDFIKGTHNADGPLPRAAQRAELGG